MIYMTRSVYTIHVQYYKICTCVYENMNTKRFHSTYVHNNIKFIIIFNQMYAQNLIDSSIVS